MHGGINKSNGINVGRNKKIKRAKKRGEEDEDLPRMDIQVNEGRYDRHRGISCMPGMNRKRSPHRMIQFEPEDEPPLALTSRATLAAS